MTQALGAYSHSHRTQDFDLHGIVGVRLLDAEPKQVAMVRRQLGPLEAPLQREPDITVRFVDSATSSPVTFVGVNDCGFNDDGFFVLRGAGAVGARALLPFGRIGAHPVIVCERSMPTVPHLLAIINLTAISKGVLPLHASAWTANGVGILVTGWAKGGKTESLLGSMARGAGYVGDEWVYLTEDGGMHGLPEPIRLWSWHLRQLRNVLADRPRRERFRLTVWHHAAGVARRASSPGVPGAAFARRGLPVVQRQAYLQIPPADLFGAENVHLHGRLDTALLVLSQDSPAYDVRPAEPGELSARMTASLTTERAQFLDHYHQFCFAFPEQRNPSVDGVEMAERDLLTNRLDRVPASTVLHPYPCDVAKLASVVDAAAREAVSH